MPSIQAVRTLPATDDPRDDASRVTETSDRHRLVDIGAVADYLGVNVRYVRRLVAERDIPFIKFRRLLRFDLEVIDRWVDLGRRGEDQLNAVAGSRRR